MGAKGSWESKLAERTERFAETLESLVTAAGLPPVSPSAIWLASAATDLVRTGEADVAGLLRRVEEARALVAQKVLPQPLLASRRVNVALERMQAATSWEDVQRSAPAELCWAGDFERVLFSRIEGSTWLPATWHVVDDPHSPANAAFGAFAHGARIPLTNGMLEAEIVRRRVTALVSDAASEPRTFHALRDIAQTDGYVIAPVISGGAVVGLLHADAHVSDRVLSEADRATIRAFADGIGLLLERLALVERLQHQRKEIADALAAAGRMVDDLCEAPVLLSADAETCLPEQRAETEATPTDKLTVREREVFSLLISGATNAEIANRLTVSETTVKSHVKHILRKLRASNRAEAIAKYLAAGALKGRAS